RLSAAQQRRLQEQLRTHAIDPERARAWCQRVFGCAALEQLSAPQAERLMARLTRFAAELQGADGQAGTPRPGEAGARAPERPPGQPRGDATGAPA
ncbi:MAG: hypothetical protein GVY22_11280, partial [Gammaproteobacteria bacterium]|nr:hypothetical protein [Gammaproteobacteria bacterium]